MRSVLAWLTIVPACAAPSASYERSLRAFLRAPTEQQAERAADLRALIVGDALWPGARLAAVHQGQLAGQPLDADVLLDAEAAEFPAAARFLASYRELFDLPARTTTQPALGVVLIVLDDCTQHRDTRADFLATAERPLREQGYYVVPVEVARDLLPRLSDADALQQGRTEPRALRRLADVGIDTCLVIDVRDFWVHEALAVEAARFEVRYQLVATSSGSVRWAQPSAGYYERREPTTAFPDDDETFFYPAGLGPVFADQIDFVRALVRGGLRALPPPR
jgi:hypothetical protein